MLIPRRLHVRAPLIHVIDRALAPSGRIARLVHVTPERVEAEIEGDLAMDEGAVSSRGMRIDRRAVDLEPEIEPLVDRIDLKSVEHLFPGRARPIWVEVVDRYVA